MHALRSSTRAENHSSRPARLQATIERFLLWQNRDKIVEPFGESAQAVFAKISAYRDSMDGPSIHDQGIVNTDPRFIYVPFKGVNLIPTDVRPHWSALCAHARLVRLSVAGCESVHNLRCAFQSCEGERY